MKATRRLAVLGLMPFTLFCSEGQPAPIAPPDLDPPPGPLLPPPPLDPTGWVTATNGTIPLIIVAPHGGDLSPAGLPDRTCAGCETLNDGNTQALALEIAAAFERRIGRSPFVVINRLHRRKFDGNREQIEATGGYSPLDTMWRLFHLRVDSAKARAGAVHPHALLIDLHGHAHTIPRLELGYLISAAQLRLADDLVTPLVAASSIARLDTAAVSSDSGAALLRGAGALGTLLQVLGYPSVPSSFDPAPDVGESYFSGGYNTERHGSKVGGAVDALQIECHSPGVRDSAANRTAFAEALVTALLVFLDLQYGWVPS